MLGGEICGSWHNASIHKSESPRAANPRGFLNNQPGWDRAVLDIMETLPYLAPLLKSYPPTDEGRRRRMQQLTLPVLRSKFFRGGGRDRDQVLIQALTDDQAAPKNVQLGRKTRRAAL